MNGWSRVWAGLVCAGLSLATAPGRAEFGPMPMAVVRPGGGMLAADGVSQVPLQIMLMGQDDGPGIKSARIVASEGRITQTRVVGPSRVQFLYAPPKKTRGLDEIFDVALTMTDGNTIAEAFTLAVPPPAAPTVELSADPSRLTPDTTDSIALQATAYGKGLEGLVIYADNGRVESEGATGGQDALVEKATLQLPALPHDAPSHFVIVGVASAETGFAVQLADVPVAAPVRLSVEIRPGSKLMVKGALNDPAPVTALADGRTVMEGVEVDLGSPLKIYELRRRKRRQLSIIVPTGVVSTGVAVPIPGQAVADGGTGPSVVVVIPPPAFGAPTFWPDIEVEGAKLVETNDLGPRMKVLVLERPSEPKKIRITLDESEAGIIEFAAARGQNVRLQPLAPSNDERAAVSVIVTTSEGAPTNHPEPRVRLATGGDLPLERVADGRYRAHIPAGTPGAPDSQLEVIAELPPLPRVTGAPLEYAQSNLRVTLAGPPPALKAKDRVEAPPPVVRPRGPGLKVGVSVQALIGSSFGSLLMAGGAVMGEVRLPIADQRLAVRFGVEFVRGSGTGRVAFDEERRLETTTTVAGFLFPFDFGFAMIQTDLFELLVRVGGAVRIEQGGLQIQGDAPGAGSRVGFGARGGLEGALEAGPGAIFMGATLDGLGANLSGLSTEQVALSGSLMNIRGDVGYRLWF